MEFYRGNSLEISIQRKKTKNTGRVGAVNIIDNRLKLKHFHRLFLVFFATLHSFINPSYSLEIKKTKINRQPYLGITPLSTINIVQTSLPQNQLKRTPAAYINKNLTFNQKLKNNKMKKDLIAKNGNEKENENEKNFLDASALEPAKELSRPLWINQLFATDESKILENVQTKVKEWEQKEKYATEWNLESTGLYQTDDRSKKISYLTKQTLKYFDKKISAESKKAEEGSALKTVSNAQVVLKPTSEVPLTPYLKLRFRAHVLQGKATVFVNNPYVDWNANVNARGNLNVHLGKDLQVFGIKTEVNYHGHEGIWEAAINKQIFENISGQVSSRQETNDMAFAGESDKKVQFNFSAPF